jgi:hypothetical protein
MSELRKWGSVKDPLVLEVRSRQKFIERDNNFAHRATRRNLVAACLHRERRYRAIFAILGMLWRQR